MEWVIRARDNGWSVEELTREVNKIKRINPQDITEKPEPYKCEECDHWRLKDLSSFDICRGHYQFNEGQLNYE